MARALVPAQVATALDFNQTMLMLLRNAEGEEPIPLEVRKSLTASWRAAAGCLNQWWSGEMDYGMSVPIIIDDDKDDEDDDEDIDIVVEMPDG